MSYTYIYLDRKILSMVYSLKSLAAHMKVLIKLSSLGI